MSDEYLRTMPHMRVRLARQALLLRLRSRAIGALTTFFAERDFVQTHTPIITSSDCEGAGEVFHVGSGQEEGAKTDEAAVHFFRSPKYLTVSSQLHLESLAQAVGKVWTLSPTFRAERSETSRHQSEFYMLEAEVNFEKNLGSLMDLCEDMLKSMTRQIQASSVGTEILKGKMSYESTADVDTRHSLLAPRWRDFTRTGAWPRITYGQAIDLLLSASTKESFTVKPRWGTGLHTEHERFLARTVGQDGPVFVTHYPRSIKPFYMIPSANDEATVDCFDLLVPDFCEIAGGSMREYRLQPLLESMRHAGLLPEDGNDVSTDEALGSLKWYVDLRRWGSAPHGGFGLGFDRVLAYLAGVSNIRDVIAFPRWVGRCDC